MKYVLVDRTTGYIVQSTRSSMTTEFTANIYNAALFASEANAEKARKKMYDKDGSLKVLRWSLEPADPSVCPQTFYTSEQTREKQATALEQSKFYADQAEDERKVPVASFDLEVRSVAFTLN